MLVKSNIIKAKVSMLPLHMKNVGWENARLYELENYIKYSILGNEYVVTKFLAVSYITLDKWNMIQIDVYGADKYGNRAKHRNENSIASKKVSFFDKGLNELTNAFLERNVIDMFKKLNINIVF